LADDWTALPRVNFDKNTDQRYNLLFIGLQQFHII